MNLHTQSLRAHTHSHAHTMYTHRSPLHARLPLERELPAQHVVSVDGRAIHTHAEGAVRQGVAQLHESVLAVIEVVQRSPPPPSYLQRHAPLLGEERTPR